MTPKGDAAYDFIIVGAGASGCTVAWRIANSKGHPRVLLVEAGGANDDISSKIDGDRYIIKMNAHQNWSYKSVPQTSCDDRVIEMDRGKGLGGSTSINFSCFTVGPSDDWDEIARIVGDDDFNWHNAANALKRIENYTAGAELLPKNAASYLKPDMANHGSKGPLRIGFARNWESNISSMLDICREAGIPLNPDINSGDPIGMGISPNSATDGLRSTAADFLTNSPPNLEIMLNAPVDRLLFEERRCIGIQVGERRMFGTKEVILSAGSLDSPKILLHSGIGPTEQLRKFDIEPRLDLPGLGQAMRDHYNIFLIWERAPHTTERHNYYRSHEKQAAAREQWHKDRTGPLADYGTTLVMGYLKSKEVEDSPEFAALPGHIKTHINSPTVPHFEHIFALTDFEYFTNPETAPPLLSAGTFLMNTQSVGRVELQSADPSVPLRFDTRFLTHEYDRRVAIEATRSLLKIANEPSFAEHTIGLRRGPASDSEEDILAYWRQTTGSTWHMSSTIPMGKTVDDGSCVDNQFRIMGIEGLRVVDMSVCPIIVNCHVQAVAYVLGLIAADKLVKQYDLE